MTNNKTLYFEGAGWFGADSSKATDVKNCRIRTAFTNNEGKKIYLEILQGNIYNQKKKNQVEKYYIHIDSIFYITDDPEIDDCNESRIKHDWLEIKNNYNYTVEDITKVINNLCNTDFNNIVTLPDLAGYRVHREKGGYNLANDFIYDKELTEKREEIKKYFYELEKSEDKKYPNFSLWVDQEDKNILHLLRHFNGYNKHWTINTDIENWLDSLKETKLGKYAC